ncbi:MAG: DUF1820 family protein [Gammaproteobacteria bacterium]|nr:MAG: DUF1820 family protein [Gammaproteobacteria bacterium]
MYKVIFYNQGELYEIYARQVSQGSLYGFVEVEQLVFGEKTSLVVDPSEERLKSEFSDVKRTYIPMHAVIRIDEVEKEGTPKIKDGGKSGTVTPFPVSAFGPNGDNSK